MSALMSAADIAAHDAASYVRSNRRPAVAGDSDPNMDEALKRVREHGQALREGLAAYDEWAAGVPA